MNSHSASATQNRAITVCLVGIIVSLLVVGIVSSTLARHIVQIAPAVLVVVVAKCRPSWASAAALPIFIFWLLIMVLIWLFLLGIARIVTGHFTATEISCTLVIGVCCLWGTSIAIRQRAWRGRLSRLLVMCGIAGLQICAMFLSLRPPFSK